MGSFSIWHWLIVLVILGGPALAINLIVKAINRRR